MSPGNKCHLPRREEEEAGGEERFQLCACGGRGKKPEVAELPSCEGRPLRTVTLTLASLLRGLETCGAGATGHHAQDSMARGT